MTSRRDEVRAVADAVLYEGYLLYPYRGSSRKNQSRWQFGVLGPQGAEARGIGENDMLSAQFCVRPRGDASVTLVVRFLQLQHRSAERDTGAGYRPVDELVCPDRSWSSWDEATACEIPFGPIRPADLDGQQHMPVTVPAGTDVEVVDGGRLVRTRRELRGELTIGADRDGELWRLTVAVRNTGGPVDTAAAATATSFLGTHVIAEVAEGEFVSLLDPPSTAADAVERCHQLRCFPVLAGPAGTSGVMLVSPIILYDHPEIAEQSRGALYDSTEIDEILTLRVMTMTDEEKAEARATDPLAAGIIDRCDSMSPQELMNLHGVLRDPHSDDRDAGLIPEVPHGVDWWDPLADEAVDPGSDAVLVSGVRVSRGSRVRLHPCRRADAQDLFFAGRIAQVSSVHSDVDGQHHIGVVIEDDPAADLHDWYGRYLYFAPDEVEPLDERSPSWR